ncbi:MAG: class I SAM-dependent methyltransferase [Gemmatimonas sp.]
MSNSRAADKDAASFSQIELWTTSNTVPAGPYQRDCHTNYILSDIELRPTRGCTAFIPRGQLDTAEKATAIKAAKAAELAAQRIVDDFVKSRPAPRVLEAGCGSRTYLSLPDDSFLVGIDISAAQLARDTRLDQKIEGDLQKHDFGSQQFDIIICWYVMEHLPDPASALRNMSRALAPGGLLIFAVPNLWSVKGLVTRFTPFFVHLWFYRMMGDRRPASEMDQFPTYLRTDMAPDNLRAGAPRLGLDVRYFRKFEGPVQRDLRDRNKLADIGFAVVGRLSTFLTARHVDLTQSDAIVVFERPS